ncbi:MAG TPA: ferrous iron transport protein B, partial [Desulfotomaculum sp.]|nr:ferrous iron transport protein B [Desulfotomaculum sp.]
APIVRTTGHKSEGMEGILEAIILVAENKISFNSQGVKYGQEIENEIKIIQDLLEKNNKIPGKHGTRWLPVKLLENDKDIRDAVNSPEIDNQIEKSVAHIEKITGESPETSIAAGRYGFISGACQEAVRSTIEIRHTVSDRIDAVLTNRVLGLPVFLGLMYLVFYLTFTLGDPPMGWIEDFFAWLSGAVAGLWPEGSDSLIKSLLTEGIIGGVGGVIVFLPNILLLFLAIAILEDTGYMARAAFIMDRLMHKIGLHGKSFIPMLIGFGCSVPAIMATRTLENRQDRLTTMLVIPLMSCGARLPIYALIIPAFFPQALHGTMLWIMYIIGILLAILSAKLLRKTIFSGESVPFVMELPPYRMPTVKSVFIHMWDRGKLYLKKAGTIILGISILLWVISTFPKLPESEIKQFESEKQMMQEKITDNEEKNKYAASIESRFAEESLRYSIAGRIGSFIEPFLKPIGFDWKIGTALIGAFAAKEVFVAQLGIVHSVGKVEEDSETLREKLKSTYNPLTGFCIMLFCLISTPCMATTAIVVRESGSWKWAMLQLGGLTIMAYIFTFIAFQAGRILGIGI